MLRPQPLRHHALQGLGKCSVPLSACFCVVGCLTFSPILFLQTKQQTTDLPNVKLLDLKGNPVVVSGVVFWQIEGVKAACLNVQSIYQYVNTTAMATLKQVVSKYPYEVSSAPSLLPLFDSADILSCFAFSPTRIPQETRRLGREEAGMVSPSKRRPHRCPRS